MEIISDRKLKPLRLEIGDISSSGKKLKDDIMKLEALFNLDLDTDIILDLFGFEALNHFTYGNMYNSDYNKEAPEYIEIKGEKLKWTLHGVIILTISDFVEVLFRHNVTLKLTKYALNKYF